MGWKDRHSAAVRWLPPALLPLLAVVVLPGGESAFDLPKRAVLVLSALAAASLALVRPAPGPRLPALAAAVWLAITACSALAGAVVRPEALVTDAAAGILLLALLHLAVDAGRVQRSAALAGAIVAGAALLQWAGVDPLGWAGWSAAGATGRLRIYGTLGNPDFVAGFVGAALCLSAGELASARSRTARTALGLAIAVMALGLAATRSLATPPALLAAAIVVAAASPGSERRRLGGAALLLLVAATTAVAASDRDGGRALAGRLYLWRTAAPAALARPLLGHGPGSVAVLHGGWEAARWAGRADPSERRFVGAQDHLHSDWLERLVEQGVLGVAALLLLLGSCAGAALPAIRRGGEGWGRAAGAVAAVAFLAARAAVDFPLARPAELTILVLSLAVAARTPLEIESSPEKP
jgi:O-antigen ligase